MARSAKEKASTLVLLGHLKKGSTGRLEVGSGDGAVSVYLLGGDVVAATSAVDPSVLIRRCSNASILSAADRDILRSHPNDEIFGLLLDKVTDDRFDDILRARFEENLCQYLVSSRKPRFERLKSVFVDNLQMGQETSSLVERLILRCDKAQSLELEQMLVKGKVQLPGQPGRWLDCLTSKPQSVESILPMLPIEATEARALLVDAWHAGAAWTPEEAVREASRLPSKAPAGASHVTGSTPVPPVMERPRKSSTPKPPPNPEELDAEALLQTVSPAPRDVRLGSAAATGAAAGGAASSLSYGAPAVMPADAMELSEADLEVVGDADLEPVSDLPDDEEEDDEDDLTVLDDLKSLDETEPTVMATPKAAPVPEPVEEVASSVLPATTGKSSVPPLPNAQPLVPSFVDWREDDLENDLTEGGDMPSEEVDERVSALPPLSYVSKPQKREMDSLSVDETLLDAEADDEDIDDAPTIHSPVTDSMQAQLDREAAKGAPSSLADWLSATADVEDDELDFFEDHDHDRGAANDGAFSSTSHNLDTVSMEEETSDQDEIIEVGEAPTARFSAPPLDYGEAQTRLDVANDCLKSVVKAFDDVDGRGRGRAVVQLLVDGSPSQFSALFVGIQVSDVGELDPERLLRNLYARPASEHRMLLGKALVDIIERALSSAADELPDEGFDAVYEGLAGYRQKLSL